VKIWSCFFSQTGSEIYNLSKTLKRVPDVIITNKSIDNIDTINKGLVDEYFDRILFLPNKPNIEEYETAIPESSVVTLHGYLRIVPAIICENYEIYNLHPAPLTTYPFLKGQDPQKKIFEQKLPLGGNTIHRCTAELDSGEILLEENFNVRGLNLDTLIALTHKKASGLWYNFLKERLK
jgi:folate-dependent phosphoribosylglycinamide formyltransferase PurN